MLYIWIKFNGACDACVIWVVNIYKCCIYLVINTFYYHYEWTAAYDLVTFILIISLHWCICTELTKTGDSLRLYPKQKVKKQLAEK